jgi:tRNA (adenine57-N1/adenine58-N1)-methyltransferase
MSSRLIASGEEILLYLNERKSWIVKVEEGKKFHCHKGIVDLGDIVGKPYGYEAVTTLGARLNAMPADYLDHLERIARRTQVIYPKDMAYIALMANVRSGSRVLECGTGSGALTSYLAGLVRPGGKVITYEMREEFQDNAKRNIEKLGLSDSVEFRLKDLVAGIEESDLDSMVLDMATPWLVMDRAYGALRAGGRLVSFSPTINQIEKTVEEMRRVGFVSIKAVELIMRTYKVKANETRPDMVMVGHTGYIVSARKC